MIASFWTGKEKGQGYSHVRSDGCSCCSAEYDIKTDKKRILEQLQQNAIIVKKVCKHYKLDWHKFMTKAPSEYELEDK